MKKPVLTIGKVFDACNKYQWFTEGTNRQYKKFLDKIEGGASLKEIVLMIWLFTPDVTEGDIEIKLTSFCLGDC